MNMRIAAVLLVGFVSLGAVRAAAAGGTPLTAAQRQALTTQLRDAEQRYGVVGYSVVILRDGQPVFSAARGQANLEHAVPVSERTVFPLFSTSKLFAIVTLMQLVEAGKVSLEAPLSRYLPDLPAAWQQVTVLQALSHQSGLPNYANAPPSMLPRRAEDALKPVAEQPLQFEPGSAARYSQTNNLLLARVIEKVTGQGFVQAVTARMLQPLGLTQTRYGGEYAIVPGRATPYRGSPQGLRVHGLADFPEYAFASAGLNSSAAELTSWARALLGGKLVSASTLKALWQPQPVGKNSVPGPYAHGWEYARAGNITAVGHMGGGIVDLRHFLRDGDGRSVTVIYLSNGSQRWFAAPELSARLAEVLVPGAVFPQQALKDAMTRALEKGDVPKAVAHYRAFRAAPATRTVPTEELVNGLGNELMSAHGPRRALPLFELNAQEHPTSGNAHDSLGEAHLALGDVERAAVHYARAVELDPRNENARRIVEDLKRRKGAGAGQSAR